MKVKSIIKKIKEYRHRDRSKLYITTRRDWNIILLVVFVLLILSFIFNYYVYIGSVVYGDRVVTFEDGTKKTLEIEEFKEDLDNVFIYFEKKKQYHQNLLEEKKNFMDFVTGDVENYLNGIAVPEEGENKKTSVFEMFIGNMSNMASVWKNVFIDLFR